MLSSKEKQKSLVLALTFVRSGHYSSTHENALTVKQVGTVERKTAPLPEGLDEVKDGIHSGGGSVGIPPRESGKGGHEPHHPAGENTGLGT